MDNNVCTLIFELFMAFAQGSLCIPGKRCNNVTPAGPTFRRVDGRSGTIVQWAERPTGHGLWRTPGRPDPPGRPSPGLLETRAAPARTTGSALTTSCKTRRTKSEDSGISGPTRRRLWARVKNGQKTSGRLWAAPTEGTELNISATESREWR